MRRPRTYTSSLAAGASLPSSVFLARMPFGIARNTDLGLARRDSNSKETPTAEGRRAAASSEPSPPRWGCLEKSRAFGRGGYMPRQGHGAGRSIHRRCGPKVPRA
eukprot:scaffold36143_cov31-Tisochrysis_lutea.AAC.9